MGFIYVILALFAPRLFLFFIWVFSDWFNLAYQTHIWPILGFFFMPFTTLAYMAAMLSNDGNVTGGWVFLMIIAVIFDLAAGGSSASEGSSSD
jgi:hypothetical protein